MEKYLKSVTKQNTKKILEQMDEPIYKLDESLEIGIFCYVKNKNQNIPVLITNTKVINEKEYKTGIKVSINNVSKIIELTEKRYINNEYNLSIIEIKKKSCNDINFLELDDKLYEEESEMYYDKESIYVLHYNKNNNISVTYGIIYDINKSQIICSSNFKSYSNLNGFPIFNLTNNKLIGIYKNMSSYFIKGIFLKSLISNFIKEYNKKPNLIYISIDVGKEDINKDIYFLDNQEYEDKDGKKCYHDNLKELNEFNTKLFINEKEGKYSKYFIPKVEGQYNIKIQFNINLTNSSFMFAGCKTIKNISFINFNRKQITNMKYMFSNCENIKKINLFSFNTINVTDMSKLFYNCKRLKSLNLLSFNTKKVIDMNNMFYCCNNLENLNISSFNTKNVINMECLFYECFKLKFLDLSIFDTKNVTNMSWMFSYCENLTNVNLDSFNTKKVNNMSFMFYKCKNLKELNISSFDIKNVNNIESMFEQCESLKILNANSFDIKNVKNMKNLFFKCNNLITINCNIKKPIEIHMLFNGSSSGIKKNIIF